MSKISLIMPMAGRGSRFSKMGIKEPKPLIILDNKPFFWWAIESINKATKIEKIIAIVLKEHINEFAIDCKIKEYYPNAQIIALDNVTSGAAQTAAIGASVLDEDEVFAINDCDHVFKIQKIDNIIDGLEKNLQGALVAFKSDSPNYSYAKIKAQTDNYLYVENTVEKQVISPYAIAGCYFFSSKKVFFDAYNEYQKNCEYDEMFLSGIYNIICKNGGNIGLQELSQHISFGTPEELELVDYNKLSNIWNEY